MKEIIFYILSSIILVSSVLTVTTNKILRAAVYLLFALVAIAGFYFMMDYQFLAAVQLTVYAGGIVVLIIFSILLTHQINTNLEKASLFKKILSAITALLGSILVISIIYQFPFNSIISSLPVDASVNAIGKQLLGYGENGYVLPFEVISVLLLAAMIGGIIIAKKKKDD